MARKDYIEKITQNLEHLTKDELKDVATLTNAQFGVRLKVAEKEYWEKEITDLKSQLQQQALPAVPGCVAKWIEYVKEDGIFNALALLDKDDMPEGVNEWLFLQNNDDNINLILRAWLDGYTVEKPQLFYLREKNTNYYLNKSRNNGLELVVNPYFDEDNEFTKQEIDSMETGSYELVPVEGRE